MIRRPPRSTRTDTLFPYTTLFRSSKLTSKQRPPRSFVREVLACCSTASRKAPIAPFLTWRVTVTTNVAVRSEEHTSELQSLMRISYAVFCLKKKTYTKHLLLYRTA